MIRACKRKKSAVLVTFILFEGLFVKKLIKIIFSSITVQVLDKQLFFLLRFSSSYLMSESFPGIHLRVLDFNLVFITSNVYGLLFLILFRLCIELLTGMKEFSAMVLKGMLSLPWELKLVSESKMTVCVSINVFIMVSFKPTSFCKKESFSAVSQSFHTLECYQILIYCH